MAGAALGEGAAAESPANPARKETRRPFRYCLNTATIRGQKLGLVKEIEVAAKAGYDAIEPWVEAIQKHVESGGTPGPLDLRLQVIVPERKKFLLDTETVFCSDWLG